MKRSYLITIDSDEQIFHIEDVLAELAADMYKDAGIPATVEGHKVEQDVRHNRWKA